MTTEPPTELDANRYRLEPDRYRQIFERRIVPYELAGGVSQKRPRVLLLGGQTGAGKSVMKGMLAAEPHWREAVEFGSDSLRVYHPEFERLLRADADSACFYTDPDARAWVSDALDHCLERRFPVVFDSTLSRPAIAASIKQRFRQAGYEIEAAFVAAPAALSKLGVVTRYLESVRRRGTGRFSLNHDETYRGVVDVAGWIDDEKPFDEVSVYRRSGELLYQYKAADGWVPTNARGVIENERRRPWSAPESRRFIADAERAAATVDAITVAGRQLDPIWLTRIADAVELAIPLSADSMTRHLRDTLRQEANARTIATETPIGADTSHPPAEPRPSTSTSHPSRSTPPGQQTAPRPTAELPSR
ncbi:hypothetical protein F1D05_12335 [Kribbella qitaiheensis]|uniref:UDP-N-acetylglucosamine kinase n=1 Tax=Kribbella qitaiheensis TaxID=1544730 RepID=A0A7G6WX33_9ACTN|nr:zeta toxin family protein [Kribbella qitaiheensis]QNE18548.1 hypothetical protein F1D05_12335 [Kribbella qitaiheensis]